VARGSNVTTNEKINIVERILVGLAAAGVERVVSMVDLSGLSAGIQKMAARTTSVIPAIEFLDHEITRGRRDTLTAVEQMGATGVGAIVVLGGDGTHRAVAERSEDIPVVGLSTGTNNAFPAVRESTIAGMAAGLVATGTVPRRAVSARAKLVVVESADERHAGLVDVMVTTDDRVGAGAMVDPDTLDELFLAFAEPQAIGMSSIGGLTRPTPRHVPEGLHLDLGRGRTVSAPIAPGLVLPVRVAEFRPLPPYEKVQVRLDAGVIAIDGEREFRFIPTSRPTVHIDPDGPVIVDVDAVMNLAAERGLFETP
jgi:predicted polyphosphate/ATP-dependent NAD kinase